MGQGCPASRKIKANWFRRGRALTIVGCWLSYWLKRSSLHFRASNSSIRNETICLVPVRLHFLCEPTFSNVAGSRPPQHSFHRSWWPQAVDGLLRWRSCDYAAHGSTGSKRSFSENIDTFKFLKFEIFWIYWGII